MQHLFEVPLRAELSKQLGKLSGNDVFIDVGACVGTSCLLMKRGVCFAFEFDPDAVKELKRNIALNPSMKIQIVESAVSDEETGYELKRKDRLGDTFLVKNKAISFPKTVILDTFFKHTPNIKLLKIDAEGEDYNVLLGARQLLRKHHPWVIAEAWNKQIESDITRFLQQLGYATRNIGINVVGEYQRNKRRLEITTKVGCSVNCHYCPQDVILNLYQNNMRELTMDSFKNILSHTPKDVTIEFAGFCEPFLNADCVGMVEYACQNGYHVILDTTLTGLNKVDVQRLAKLDYEAISLHLPDNRNNTNIPTESIGYKETLTSLLTSLQIDSFVSMNDTFVSNTRAGNCHEPHRSSMGMFICGKLQSNPSPVVLPNGDVYLCCMDYGLKHKLGNLFQTDYDTILNSVAYQKVRKSQFKHGDDVLCHTCLFAVPVVRHLARKIVSGLVISGNASATIIGKAKRVARGLIKH